MPSPAVALFWMLFTLFSTLGMLYLVAIRKVHIQMKYVNSGIAAKFNNGRIISIIVCFCVSVICMASLLLESPKWDSVVWVIVFVTVVLYPMISMIVEYFVRRQYEQVFCLSAKVLWTCTILGLLMCASYCVWSNFDGASQQSYETVFQALINTRQPLVNANSPLLQEAGIGLWLNESITNFGMDQISKLEAWEPVCAIIRVVVSVGAFFGMAHLLSMCAVPCGELKKGFASIADIKNNEEIRVRIRYVLVAALLPIALVGSFVWADDRVDEALQSEEGTALRTLTHRVVAGTTVCRIGDNYYDLTEFRKDAEFKFGALQEKMVALKYEGIPEAYDSCDEGIEKFLDWFFGIPNDNSVRMDISEKDVLQVVQNSFYGSFDNDKDTLLTKQVDECVYAAEELMRLLEKGKGLVPLNRVEEPNTPSWFVDPVDVSTAPEFYQYRKVAQGIIDVARDERLSASLREGQTILEHQFSNYVYSNDQFKSMVSSVEAITGKGGIVSDVRNQLRWRFDDLTKRTQLRKDFEEMLKTCRSQTELLVKDIPQVE